MRKKLLMGFCALMAVMATFAQTTTVTGTVMDDKGSPIPSASIVEKGTRNGATAGTDGNFSIKVKTGAALVISAVGYEDRQVAASGSKMIIQLTSDVKSLSEVVVTGTGVATSKKKLGISVESITADKLPQAPTSSISQALVGKVAGAQISTIDGTPGARVNILLRGVNSLRGGTSPMILIDGLEVRATDLGALDLNNVERIEVVEGAASSTLYGAQGANGAIQIFTKRGKIGQPTIDFSTSYGSGSYINNGNVHQAYTHGFKTDAAGNVVDANNVIIAIKPDGTYTPGVNINGVTQGALVWLNTNPYTDGSKPYNMNLKFYDHWAQTFKSAQNVNASLSIAGAANKLDYALTFSHTRQESNIINNGELKRTNFTANIGAELFKGFRVRSSTQLVYSKNNFNPYFTSGPNRLFSVQNTSPFFDFEWKDANGNYPYALNASPVSVNAYNPNYYTQYSYGTDEIIDLIQNFQASYKVNRFLDLDVKYGINYEKEDVNQVYKNQSQNINAVSRGTFIGGFTSNAGGVSNGAYNTTFQNALTTATLNLDLQKDFNLKLPITSTTYVGYDYRKNVSKSYVSSGDGLQLYPIYSVTQTNTRNVSTDNVTPFVTFGTFINEAIDYAGIAGIKGGLRSDYSSAFGAGSEPQTFYNGNAYFRLSQLKFWNALSGFMPEFKLRGGYGEAGIQPGAFNRYVTLSTRNIGNNLAFFTPNVQSNPNLQVEVSKESEIGLDITFKLGHGSWLSSATLNSTYWKRTSEDVIYTVDAPPSSGGGGFLTNAFSLKSNGYTFALNLAVAKTRDFSWDFTANFNHQTSEIGSISTGQEIVVTSGAGYGNYVLRPGSKIGQLYGLKTFRSVEQTRQDGTAYIDKANYGKYQLVNGTLVDTATKGIMFTNENYAFGDPNPKFNMSFINYISFKGLMLNFQFDWVYGSHLYNQTKEWMYRDGIHGDWGEKITINGQTGAWANYYTSAYADQWGSINGARNAVKDYFYEDASFVRLRNIALSYDFAGLLKVKAVKKLQLVLTGRNLWTITKYTGFDPEVSSGTVNSGFDRGVDYASTPNLKTYQVGINVGF
jgi:TonB-linked SusC/RagA family outer membrane protein